MSQSLILLEHMRRGRVLTPALAYALTGSLALHSRIAEIRRMGYRVEKKMVCSNGKRWGEYTIPPEQQHPKDKT
jgi:hypothetical protein